MTVRPLQEADLGEADRIMRLAFGTFLGFPDPGAFMGDADYVRTRWAADPPSAIPGPGAGRSPRLIAACEAFATQHGAQAVVASVNSSRRGAHQALLDRGYRAQLVGVTMHKPDESAYHDEHAWVIDDWR